MNLTDNYKALALAILRQAQLDYGKDTYTILKFQDKIKTLKKGKKYLNKDDKEKIALWNAIISTKEADKRITLEFWENSHATLYYSLVEYDAGVARFQEIEKTAIEDYQNGKRCSLKRK